MRIATWNVNSINARLETVLTWFREAAPDVACLQEIKCVDEKFPSEAFKSLGYNVAVHGQKTYNGVALLSKTPLEDVRKGLPGEDEDDHARYLEALVSGPIPVRVAAIYLPNGNPIGTDKFAYKLRWLDRLNAHARELLAYEEPLVLAGDYNVIPEPEDADKPEGWLGDALFQPESRGAFRALKWLGLTDAYMAADGEPGGYTFWDYQAGAWNRNHGIRIDHLLLSPQAADRLTGVTIHRDVRGREKPSDHVPVVAELNLGDPPTLIHRRAALIGLTLTPGLAQARDLLPPAPAVQSRGRAEARVMAKRVTKNLRERGVRLGLVFRSGLPRRMMPPGLGYTHCGFWVRHDDVGDEDPYIVHGLFTGDDITALRTRSILVTQLPADFMVRSLEDDVGVIIPTPELQDRLIAMIGSPTYLALHNPEYAVTANPFASRYQNCCTFVLYLIAAAAWGLRDPEAIRARLKDRFKPSVVKANFIVRTLGPLLEERAAVDDQKGPIVTAAYESMRAFMVEQKFAADAYILPTNA